MMLQLLNFISNVHYWVLHFILYIFQDLWESAPKYPLHGMLHDMSEYIFQHINSLSAYENVEDENKRLRDLKPYFGILRIIERRTDNAGDNLLNSQISNLIGKGENFLLLGICYPC